MGVGGNSIGPARAESPPGIVLPSPSLIWPTSPPQSLVYPCVFARCLDVIHAVVVNGFLPTPHIVVPSRHSSTPFGSPASSARTAKRRLANRLFSLGLIIMTLPVASAGADLRAMLANWSIPWINTHCCSQGLVTNDFSERNSRVSTWDVGTWAFA